MTLVARRFKAILIASDVAPSELFLALYTLIWGLGLLTPPQQFLLNPTVYVKMGAVMPEEAWGALFASAGIIALFTALRGDVPCRQISVAGMALAWFSVIGFMVETGAWPAALFHFSLVEIALLWVYWRLASPSKVSNE